MPRGIGQPFSGCQQRLPVGARQPAVVPVGARMFSAMVKKTDVVVALLERLNLALDEFIHLQYGVAVALGARLNIHVFDHEVDDAIGADLQPGSDHARQQAMDFRGRDFVAELHELVAALVKVEGEGFILLQMSGSLSCALCREVCG